MNTSTQIITPAQYEEIGSLLYDEIRSNHVDGFDNKSIDFNGMEFNVSGWAVWGEEGYLVSIHVSEFTTWLDGEEVNLYADHHKIEYNTRKAA